MTKTNLDWALEYLQRGWSVVPVKPGMKHPGGIDFGVDAKGDPITWKEFSRRRMTEEEAERYWGENPQYGVELIVGEISGVMALDTDTPEAEKWIQANGLTSPVAMRTPRGGWHYYFKYDPENLIPSDSNLPVFDGKGNPVKGLDGRGPTGLLMMHPSEGYEWSLSPGADMEDLPDFRGFPVKPSVAEPTTFEQIDLKNVTVETGEMGFDVFVEAIKRQVADHGLIEEGGRNNLLAKFVGHCLREGVIEEALVTYANRFMEFFDSPLPEIEMMATIKSVTAKDAKAYPGRAEEAAIERLAKKSDAAKKAAESNAATREADDEAKAQAMADTFKTYRMGDVDDLRAEAGESHYFMEPWVRNDSIIQVFGFSGHGKSLFLQHAMIAMASGRSSFGPFAINQRDGKRTKVLYFDLENGKGMVADRLEDMGRMYDDAGEWFNVWMPDGKTDGADMNLSDPAAKRAFELFVDRHEPDVVVIDTVRSAFSIEENDSSAWREVNKVAVKQSLAGRTVIMTHHSNKPTKDGLGHSAGSSNQLTRLIRQVRLVQVFRTRPEADRMSGVHEEVYGNGKSIWDQLSAQLPATHRLKRVMEITFLKARDITDEDDDCQWIGLARPVKGDGADIVVSSVSTRQRAEEMALKGFSVEEISDILEKRESVIEGWLGLEA